uniref:Putative product n=1 Tax=Xenopsylla cheopis TaxID=163159 RepID=A0A6M2DV97_XENCH
MQAKRIKSVLLPPLNRNGPLPADLKLTIYKLLIRPILTYASASWITTPLTNRLKLQRVHNSAIRLITGKCINPSTNHYYPTQLLHEETELATLWQHIMKAAGAFHNRCRENTNETIENIWMADEQNTWYTGHQIPGAIIAGEENNNTRHTYTATQTHTHTHTHLPIRCFWRLRL